MSKFQRKMQLPVLAVSLALGLGLATSAFAQATPYHVSPGDTLTVTAYGNPALSGLYPVDDSGTIGYPIIGHVVAHRGGHALHTAFAARILEETDAWRLVESVGELVEPGRVPVAVGSAVLHVIKLVLGRRRPRDDMEMGLYGFMPFAFNLDYNSFPSGHALTISCVAVIFTCVWPMLWPLWAAIAALLAVTRTLLTEHFLSDVLIGAGIGLIAALEVLLLGFPGFTPGFF